MSSITGCQEMGKPCLKVTAPPGGRSSIFSPDPQESGPRKVIDYQKSRIFEDDNANEISRKSVSPSPKHAINTQSRLFGESAVEKSPSRRISDTYRSSLFGPDSGLDTTPSKSPRKTLERNPITGKSAQNGVVHVNGGAHLTEDVSPQVNGVAHNGVHQNGLHNGTEHGQMNGHHQNGITNGVHEVHSNGVHNGTEQ